MDLMVYALCRRLIAEASLSSTNGNIFTIKGSVVTFDDLPLSGNANGDVYLVGPRSDGSYDEYFWTDASVWELLGTTAINLSEEYITLEELQGYLKDYALVADLTGYVTDEELAQQLEEVAAESELQFI